MDQENIIPIINDEGIYDEGWENGLKDFPGIEELQNNLDALMAIDKSQMSQDEIRTLAYQKLVMLPNASNTIKKDIFNSQPFWRTRKNVMDNEDVTQVSTFSYPPSCSNNGRANLKSKSVFYCSNGRSTALFESRPLVGEIVYLTEWSTLSDRDVQIRFLLSESLSESNPFYGFMLRQIEEIKGFSKRYGKEKAMQLEMITRFLANAFVIENPPYAFTSWLANEILFGATPVDVLYYPSVTTQKISCNLAISPSFTDKYLSAKRIYKLQITEQTETNIRQEIVAVGDINNKKIVWRETTQSDFNYLNGK